MAFSNKCLLGCPKCKGYSCSKRQTEVVRQVIVNTGRQEILCEERSGMLHIAENRAVSIEMMNTLGIIKLEDWVPDDGRVCKIGGLGFRK